MVDELAEALDLQFLCVGVELFAAALAHRCFVVLFRALASAANFSCSHRGSPKLGRLSSDGAVVRYRADVQLILRSYHVATRPLNANSPLTRGSRASVQ